MQQLPLFPLGTVLVPGLLLPLHVFEPRYRRLVRDLLERPKEERVFGVVAIKAGTEVGRDGVRALYDVGCTAVLREVTPHDDGRYDLVTSGAVRFRLHSAAESTPGEDAYLVGEVSPLRDDDDPDEDVAGPALEVAALFRAYRERLGTAPAQLPSSPRALSYLVAADMLLDVRERQALLEQPDTAGRLEAERRLLRRERALIDALGAVPGADVAWGKVNPS